tara:strand:+ start:406 stop:531 length:126 start_codon:yes stop_codon:yes gene_type:complete
MKLTRFKTGKLNREGNLKKPTLNQIVHHLPKDSLIHFGEIL